jgi:hypothetical protein
MANSINSKDGAYANLSSLRAPSTAPAESSDPSGNIQPKTARTDVGAKVSADAPDIPSGALQAGANALAVDADIGATQALQQAQLISAQLGTQPLAIANRQPSVLLGLFR